jgi:hypothetical protein
MHARGISDLGCAPTMRWRFALACVPTGPYFDHASVEIRYSPLKQMSTRNVALIHRPVERKSRIFDARLTRRRPETSESLGRPRLASAVRIGFTSGHQHPKGDAK